MGRPDSGLSIAAEADGARQRIRIAGEVDLYTAPRLQQMTFETLNVARRPLTWRG